MQSMSLRCFSQVAKLAQPMAAATASRERRLLRGVLHEALQRELRKREALEMEQGKLNQQQPGQGQDPGESAAASKARMKAQRRAEIIPKGLTECAEQIEYLTSLHTEVESHLEVSEAREQLEALGFGPRLAAFDVDALPLWGRPRGFLGRVFESPNGVPVLVSRQSFSDELLRQVSTRSDLWLQVREGRGARVMLWLEYAQQRQAGSPTLPNAPTAFFAPPPLRGCYRGPTRRYGQDRGACLQFAADIAAYYSEHRRRQSADDDHGRGIEVMYTDSRRVAARGDRAGQLKDSKKLGVLHGDPSAVAEAAEQVEAEQADLL